VGIGAGVCTSGKVTQPSESRLRRSNLAAVGLGFANFSVLIDDEATSKQVVLTFNYTVSEASSKWRQNANQDSRTTQT
jgi:hypothetical protein